MTQTPRLTAPLFALLVTICVMLAALSFLAPCQGAVPPPPRALVLDDPSLPGYDAGLGGALKDTLALVGYNAVSADTDALMPPGALGPGHCALLVLPQARHLPAVLISAVSNYVKRGGNLLVLGAPAWQIPTTVKRDGLWRTSGEDAGAQVLLPPSTPFLDFRADFPATALIRETNAEKTPTTIVSEPSGGGQGRLSGALHVTILDLNGWDMWRTPDLVASPFAPGQTVTVLSARGDSRTHRLSLEWDDRDGSRWIAVIPLAEQWQRYALTPADFHAWGVSSAERERAGFDPANVIRFKAGMAFTHTGRIGGRHEYWLAGVGTEAALGGAVRPMDIPALETISPAYKFSPLHGHVRLDTPPGEALVTPQEWEDVDPSAWGIASSPPRPGGTGFDKGRDWRWQPLLVARDIRTGQWRGVPATLFVHKPDGGGLDAGGVWAAFAVEDASFYRQKATLRLIGDVARRMREGLFLLDGGASCYTLLPGQSVRLGAMLANLSAGRRSAEVSVTVSAPKSVMPVWKRAWPLGVDGRTSLATPPTEWTPPAGKFPTDGYTVTTELRADGALVDRLQHSLYQWDPPPAPQYVAVGGDGHFHLGGALWRPCGVNYTPSSGIAQENDDLYQRWMDPPAYDPETVERDLYHIQNLGINAVSAWVYPTDGAWQNLLDFLRRCRAHHLKVSLMLAPDVASTGAADTLKPLVERFRLPQNDTVIAYEIAWEPEFNGHDARRAMDDVWQKWASTHYGSIEAAKAAWQAKIPRDAGGKVTNPSDADLARPDGPEARVCAAYRRFLDDWVADRYGPVVRRLHEIDPHHAVSFRMNHAGDPTDRDGMPYGFEGVSRATDYLAPEGYGRVGGWAEVRPGWFTAAYARAVAPDKPLVWAEVGTSVWDEAAVAPAPETLAFQGRFYDDFFHMATASGADGLFFWWFAGGYRFGEGSDYGLINPDGTDRPSSLAVRRNAAAFLSAPAPAAPDVWLPFDRDAYGNGLVGVYDALSVPFWSAIVQGHRPGLRAKPAR